MSLFFKAPLEIEIRLADEELRTHIDVKSPQGRVEKLPVYKDGELVRGSVTVRTREGRRVEHLGVRVQLLGSIETNLDGVVLDDFLSLATELAAPAQLTHPETYPFEFKNVEKQYESYRGKNARLRYYVKVSVTRKSLSEITREKELWVYQVVEAPGVSAGASTSAGAGASASVRAGGAATPPKRDEGARGAAADVGARAKKDATPPTVKMDVGIEDCLHIEFEYLKLRFLLKDVVVGRIYFLLVRLKIKHMELLLIRRETVGAPPHQVTDLETVVRFEIMDGAPVRGETIPIRLFLGGFDLTPTYRDVNKKFLARTYLSLVLIDEDARRYFKQSEIILYRDQ